MKKTKKYFDYEAAIGKLGLSQVGAARFLKVGPRTSRRWIAGDARVPHAVALLLTAMIEYKIKPEDLM
jgi:hypothetical protein